MKKFTSMLLAALMLVICLAACGDTGSSGSTQQSSDSSSTSTEADNSASEEDSSETEGNAIDFDEEPYHLVVCYPVLSEAQADLPLIEAAINEITLREINATVEFEAVGLFSMANVYSLKASSQEKVDLMMLMPGASYLPNFATSNMIQPIGDEIDQWGPVIKEVLGDTLKAGQFKEQQYAIPQNKDMLVNGYGFNLLESVCIENDIDIDAIKTLEDLEAVFETVKNNEPDMIVLVPEQSGSTILTTVMSKYDTLGVNNFATLEVQGDDSIKVVDAFDDNFMQSAITVREWYEKGYISRDVTTAQESGSQMQWAGRAFASSAPSVGATMGDITNGVVRRSILLDDSSLYRTTMDAQMFIWTVPTSCQRPDKAVQFINLAFENAELTNIFRYGIEGNHYELLDDGTVELTNTAGWQNNWLVLGDRFKAYLRNDALVSAGNISLEEYWQLCNDWNDRVVDSPAYGFTFDPGSVRNEVSACNAAMNEHYNAIANGTVNPETEIPVLKEKLDNAGMYIIMEELQRQLDEWVAANK